MRTPSSPSATTNTSTAASPSSSRATTAAGGPIKTGPARRSGTTSTALLRGAGPDSCPTYRGVGGYFDYFGSSAGPRSTRSPQSGPSAHGYYSWNIGAWHVVVLNSMCYAVGDAGPARPRSGGSGRTSPRTRTRSACSLTGITRASPRASPGATPTSVLSGRHSTNTAPRSCSWDMITSTSGSPPSRPPAQPARPVRASSWSGREGKISDGSSPLGRTAKGGFEPTACFVFGSTQRLTIGDSPVSLTAPRLTAVLPPASEGRCRPSQAVS